MNNCRKLVKLLLLRGPLKMNEPALGGELPPIAKDGLVTLPDGDSHHQILAVQDHDPDSNRELSHQLIRRISSLEEEIVFCPDGKCAEHEHSNEPPLSSLLLDMILHLNDDHHWTREEIADWLDTLDVDLTIREDGNRA